MPQSYKKKRQWWLRPVGVLVILLTVIFITLLVIVGGYTIAPLYNAAQSLTPTFTTPPVHTTPTQTSRVAPATQSTDWVPYARDFDGMTLVLVPEGCFNMGFNGVGGRQCFDDPFWIDKYEVTNTDYARFMEAGGYADPGYWIEDGWAWLDAYQITQPEHWDNSDFNSPQQPVVGVSWYEALAYAQWVGVSLCTEAEWEYAARGPEELVYPWGNELIADNLVYSGNSNGQPSHTGSRLNGASWVGALDLSGNVWEWTRSEYRDYPYIMSDGRDAINGYAVQVLRGGAWDYPYQFARTTSRLPSFPEDRRNDIGFRVCRS